MLSHLKKYPLSLCIVAAIFYLSFFTPPQTDMEEIPGIDKVVHICMYGGLCTILWWEYLRTHASIHRLRTLIGAILLPIALSGAIELLQEYATTNRSGDWADMIANSIGVCTAALLGYFAFPRWVNREARDKG